jgi:hypothetical protein
MYQCSLSSCGGRAQMSDNVDSSRRVVQCRPSISPPVHGGAAVVCAKVAYDVTVLAVVVWWTRADVGQCRLVEARGAVSTIDLAARARWRRRRVRQGCLRCTSTRCCCLVGRAQMLDNVDPSRRAVQCRPSMSLPVHGGAAVVCAKVAYDVPVLAVVNGGPRADVGQCRLVEARGAVSTIDLAARARWHRRRVRQGCLRCTSARCCGMADRAQMSDNVDSSRRAVQCRPSTSPPVHGGAAVVCAKVAYDVPVLAVVVMAGRAQMSDNVDSSRRAVHCRPSTSLPVHGGAAVVCAKVAYDVPVLAVVVWWDERRCRTMSTRLWRATQCRPAVSPPVCAGAVERLKCMITHMVASNETIYSLPRGRFPCDADSPPPNVRQMQRVPVLKSNRTSHFQAPLGMHWHVRLGTNVTS